jgi:hypothetical protein
MRKVDSALAVLLLAALAPRAHAADPLHVALLLDTSGSIHKRAQAARNQLAAEIAQALPDGSEVTVYTFDDQPKLILQATKNPAEVAQAVQGLGAHGQFTALNDAVYDAARRLGDVSGRRAILVLTDGLDENSALVPEDGVNEARAQRIPVFTIGIGNVQERYLRRIAKLSGGEYYPAGTTAATLVARVVELTPAGEARAARPTAAAAAPGAPAAGATTEAAAPLQTTAPAMQTWPVLAGVGLAVVIALSALGLALMRRPAAAPAYSGGATSSPEPVPDEPEDVTLIAKMQDLQADGQTLVLTLKPLLHVQKGPNFGKFFEVSVDSATSLGRAQGNDIVLDDKAVSSQHARIRPQGGVYELIDLKSTNGTFVNERKVVRTHLSPGDLLKVGETVMQFRMDHMKG